MKAVAGLVELLGESSLAGGWADRFFKDIMTVLLSVPGRGNLSLSPVQRMALINPGSR